MYKNIHYVTYAMLFHAFYAVAADDSPVKDSGGKSEPKMVSGMSIVGNDETPKSLYIVPWTSSDSRGGVKISSDIMKEELAPVDKSTFIREIDYFNISNPASAAVSN